jgi:hypothetical protein
VTGDAAQPPRPPHPGLRPPRQRARGGRRARRRHAGSPRGVATARRHARRGGGRPWDPAAHLRAGFGNVRGSPHEPAHPGGHADRHRARPGAREVRRDPRPRRSHAGLARPRPAGAPTHDRRRRGLGALELRQGRDRPLPHGPAPARRRPLGGHRLPRRPPSAVDRARRHGTGGGSSAVRDRARGPRLAHHHARHGGDRRDRRRARGARGPLARPARRAARRDRGRPPRRGAEPHARPARAGGVAPAPLHRRRGPRAEDADRGPARAARRDAGTTGERGDLPERPARRPRAGRPPGAPRRGSAHAERGRVGRADPRR